MTPRTQTPVERLQDISGKLEDERVPLTAQDKVFLEGVGVKISLDNYSAKEVSDLIAKKLAELLLSPGATGASQTGTTEVERDNPTGASFGVRRTRGLILPEGGWDNIALRSPEIIDAVRKRIVEEGALGLNTHGGEEIDWKKLHGYCRTTPNHPLFDSGAKKEWGFGRTALLIYNCPDFPAEGSVGLVITIDKSNRGSPAKIYSTTSRHNFEVKLRVFGAKSGQEFGRFTLHQEVEAELDNGNLRLTRTAEPSSDLHRLSITPESIFKHICQGDDLRNQLQTAFGAELRKLNRLAGTPGSSDEGSAEVPLARLRGSDPHFRQIIGALPLDEDLQIIAKHLPALVQSVRTASNFAPFSYLKADVTTSIGGLRGASKK